MQARGGRLMSAERVRISTDEIERHAARVLHAMKRAGIEPSGEVQMGMLLLALSTPSGSLTRAQLVHNLAQLIRAVYTNEELSAAELAELAGEPR